jgi:transcriptional regulator with XRE-family HTH domain
MTGSAIFKIEKSEPRRRIVVDELVAFAQVFGVPLDELLLPPEVAVSKELGRLVVEWDQARKAADEAEQTRDEAWAALEAYIPSQHLAEPALERVITDWASARFDDDSKDFEIAYRMWKITGTDHWRDRVKAAFDDELKGGK